MIFLTFLYRKGSQIIRVSLTLVTRVTNYWVLSIILEYYSTKREINTPFLSQNAEGTYNNHIWDCQIKSNLSPVQQILPQTSESDPNPADHFSRSLLF